jgi:hypothetical protein
MQGDAERLTGIEADPIETDAPLLLWRGAPPGAPLVRLFSP